MKKIILMFFCVVSLQVYAPYNPPVGGEPAGGAAGLVVEFVPATPPRNLQGPVGASPGAIVQPPWAPRRALRGPRVFNFGGLAPAPLNFPPA